MSKSSTAQSAGELDAKRPEGAGRARGRIAQQAPTVGHLGQWPKCTICGVARRCFGSAKRTRSTECYWGADRNESDHQDGMSGWGIE